MKSPQIHSNLLLLGLTLYLCSSLTSMAGMSIGFVLLVGLALSGGWTPQRMKVLFQNPETRSFTVLSLLFSGVCILSLIFSAVRPPFFAGHAPQVHLLKDSFKLWYMILPFFLASILHSLRPEQRREALQRWLLFAGFCGLVGVFQFFTGLPRKQIIPSIPQFYHATLFFGHHLSTASILIFPFFVSLSLFFSGQLKEVRTRRINTAIALLSGITLILTWSRMLWIALPLGLTPFLIRAFKPRFRKWVFLSGLTAGLFFLCFFELNRPSLQDSFFHQRGTNERVALWEANLAFIQKRPLLGIGLRKSEEMAYYYFLETRPQSAASQFVGHAHNNALEILSGTGILGFITWLLWNLWILLTALQVSRLYSSQGKPLESAVAFGLFCAWITFHINGLTQVNFWEGKVMHQMMWSAGLLIFLKLNLLTEKKM